MTRRLAAGLAIIVVASFGSSKPAAAATQGGPAVYDTVDAVEVVGNRITITGIRSGDSVPTELFYVIGGSSSTQTPSTGDEAAARCDRLALLAMSKPGKFQFATVVFTTSPFRFSCKLTVRTP